MAAHLNGMHISSEFTAHNINDARRPNNALDVDEDSNETLRSYSNTLQDIEEKLKRAQKITVADVVKTIQDEPLLPVAIMEHFEKPCKALVIWQPPSRITDLIITKATQAKQTSDDEDCDNNNADFVDYNDENIIEETDMDMDGDLL